MKMKTKILSALTALSITGSMIYALPVAADTVVVTSNGIKWVLDDSGTLTISGSGEVMNRPTVDGRDAYSWTSKTNKVIFAEGITGITSSVFNGFRQLKEIEWSSTISYIGGGSSAFGDCDGLINIKIPDTVLSIGSHSFQNCDNLTLVELGNGVKSIGSRIFYNCPNLIRVDFGNSIEKIGDYAFSGCKNLTTTELPETVTEIGAGAFLGCNNLSKVRMRNNVKTIGNRAFESCKNLTEIDVSKNIEAIGVDAFKGCNSLICVNYGGDEASWKKVIIGAGNEILKNAQINYNCDLGGGVAPEPTPMPTPQPTPSPIIPTPQPTPQPTPTPVQDDDSIKVFVDGKAVGFDQQPIMINDRVMVPIRAVAEAIGDEVRWEGEWNAALIIHPDRVVGFKTENNTARTAKGTGLADYSEYYCDVPPQNINGRVLTPLRAIGETLGAKVEWDGSTKTVYITTGSKPAQTMNDSLVNEILRIFEKWFK